MDRSSDFYNDDIRKLRVRVPPRFNTIILFKNFGSLMCDSNSVGKSGRQWMLWWMLRPVEGLEETPEVKTT